MSDLRKAAEMALEVFEMLDKRGGLGLDVHEYIRTKIEALRQALAQPEQEPVKCMYPYCETASGCDGPCSKPLTTPVDAIKITQERVDETAKSEHEPVAWIYEWLDEYNCWNKAVHLFKPEGVVCDVKNVQPLYTAPPHHVSDVKKRE